MLKKANHARRLSKVAGDVACFNCVANQMVVANNVRIWIYQMILKSMPIE
jgi:hypothetical protein